jgi:uncharacterized membrane protein YbhN (UPF0104 family)
VIAGRLAAGLGRTGPRAPDLTQVDSFYEAGGILRRTPVASLPVIGHALAAKLLGAGVLAAALGATEADVGLGTALAVYALALVAASASLLPGGVGAVETTMTVLLTGHGVPAATALAAVVTFRLLDLWLPILIGLLAVPGLGLGSGLVPPRAARRTVETTAAPGALQLQSSS